MDRKASGTVVFRVGAVLVAVGLAFGLVSLLSATTVAGVACQDFCTPGFPLPVPPGSFVCLCSARSVISPPQQVNFFNMSSAPLDAAVYLLSANQTDFNAWIANKAGVPLSNVSGYGPQKLTVFQDYVASHKQEVLGNYTVTSSHLVLKYFTPDVEPLMMVVTNSHANSLNFSYFQAGVGAQINPSVGFVSAAYLALSGVALAAVGILLKKK